MLLSVPAHLLFGDMSARWFRDTHNKLQRGERQLCEKWQTSCSAVRSRRGLGGGWTPSSVRLMLGHSREQPRQVGSEPLNSAQLPAIHRTWPLRPFRANTLQRIQPAPQIDTVTQIKSIPR